MVLVFFIFLYCIFEIIRRILKPRTITRLCDYNFETGTAFALSIGAYVFYKIVIKGMTFKELRRLLDVRIY